MFKPVPVDPYTNLIECLLIAVENHTNWMLVISKNPERNVPQLKYAIASCEMVVELYRKVVTYDQVTNILILEKLRYENELNFLRMLMEKHNNTVNVNSK